MEGLLCDGFSVASNDLLDDGGCRICDFVLNVHVLVEFRGSSGRPHMVAKVNLEKHQSRNRLFFRFYLTWSKHDANFRLDADPEPVHLK